MTNKTYPKTIPYSSIDWGKLQRHMDEMVEERVKREMEAIEPQPWRPYMDLSDRRTRRKDHTGQFREVYKMFETDMRSQDKKTSDFAHLKYGAVLKEIAGRPLKVNEIKMITIHCLQKKPKMRINAFGQLYTNKVILSKDTETK
jgi:hypothetical protein